MSLLFTAKLQDSECIFITGSERFCSYSGYASTFQFKGSFIDTTPRSNNKVIIIFFSHFWKKCRDEKNRRKTTIVAMDALFFGSTNEVRMTQYKLSNVLRELNKAYCGFSDPDYTKVATGNWG